MIPLALVTGFLGSGKTTLLRRIAQGRAGRRLVFLVNEFSSNDVDGATLRADAPDVLTVAGGSIFCRCLVTEFIDALGGIPRRFGTPEGLVIEASGMSDPRALPSMLRETKLDTTWRLAGTTAVVDPKILSKLLHTLPAVRAQIEAAGTVLINKIDRSTPREIEEAERTVREIAPSARVLRTIRCETDLDPFGGAVETRGKLAPCADPDYARLVLRFSGDANEADLRRRLSDLGEDLYRAKGFVPLGGKTVRLDASVSGLEIGGDAPAGTGAELVLIVRGPASAKAAEILSGTPNATLLP